MDNDFPYALYWRVVGMRMRKEPVPQADYDELAKFDIHFVEFTW